MSTLISYSRKPCTLLTEVPDKERTIKIPFHLAISIAPNIKRITNLFNEDDLILFVRE